MWSHSGVLDSIENNQARVTHVHMLESLNILRGEN